MPSHTTGMVWRSVIDEGLIVGGGRLLQRREGRTVRAKKTEHHGADHAVRVVPICPELRALLADAFERAEPGATSIVPMASRPGVNLRTYLERIIGNAGHSLLPRLLQNLRASWAAASRALWLVRTRRRAASQSATRNAHPLQRKMRRSRHPRSPARSRTKRQNPLPPFRLQRVLRNLRQLPKLARGRMPRKKSPPGPWMARRA